MLAVLLDCIIVEQCVVIQFFWSERIKPLQDSQKNVGTMWRKLYYAKEVVPMGGKVSKWQILRKTSWAI
jgi:hypothetical protein